MKYKAGQKVRIKNNLGETLDRHVRTLAPPYIATIDYISQEYRSGEDAYILEGFSWGWFDDDIECLYIPKPKTIFDIIDLD